MVRATFVALFLNSMTGSAIDTGCAANDEASSLMQMRAPHIAKPQKQTRGGLSLDTEEGREAMLSKVRGYAEQLKNGKIDGDTGEILLGAVSTAQGVLTETALPAIQSEHDSAVEGLAMAKANVDSCKDGQTEVDSRLSTTDNLRQDHTTCREEEAGLCATKVTVCTATDHWFQHTLPDPPCEMPERSDREGIVEYLQELEAYTENQYEVTAQTKITECTDATAACNEKTAACEALQTQFEGNYCAHHAECASLSTCHDRAVTNFNAHVENMNVAIEARKTEFRVVKQIDCFLDLIVQAVGDKVAEENTGHYSDHDSAPLGEAELEHCAADVDTSHLDIAVPPLTDPEACDTSRTACSDPFDSEEYEQFVQYGMSLKDQCQPCVGAED